MRLGTIVRAGLLAVVVLVAIGAFGGWASSAPATALSGGRCEVSHHCRAPSSSTVDGRNTTPASCIHAAGCGGGAALGASSVAVVAVLTASTVAAVAALTRRWSLLVDDVALATRLQAGRLFRPPRPLLSI